MTIEEKEKEIVDEFEIFGNDWESKYEHLIEMGKNLEKLDERYKTEEALIQGCQSLVWLHTEEENGKIIFYADSDAIITKGLVALMIRVLSNHTPEEVKNSNLDFINKIGLMEHLSPTRANGLLSMIKRMKKEAN